MIFSEQYSTKRQPFKVLFTKKSFSTFFSIPPPSKLFPSPVCRHAIQIFGSGLDRFGLTRSIVKPLGKFGIVGNETITFFTASTPFRCGSAAGGGGSGGELLSTLLLFLAAACLVFGGETLETK